MKPKQEAAIAAKIFVIRHGNVADHYGDVHLTSEGFQTALNAGNSLADHISDGDDVTILFSPSERTRETAEEIASGLTRKLAAQNKKSANVPTPRAENAIRNFQFLVEGRETLPTDGMHESLPASAEQDPFFQAFWKELDDPIRHWLTHPTESAEQPAAVAARLRAFFQALLENNASGVFMLVTHSGPMRAFLREALGEDPGEPEYCEWFQVNADGVHYREKRVPFLSS